MNNPSPLAERLRADGRSFREIAFLADLAPTYVSRLAKDERKPSRETVLKLAKVLKVNPGSLLKAA